MAIADPPARAIPVLDLHVDLAYALTKGRGAGESAAALQGAVSAERLRRGGVVGIVVPLFVEGADTMSPEQARKGYEEAFSALGRAWESGVLVAPGKAAGDGQVATVLAFEGADGFAGDPTALDAWIERGARLFGIVHQRSNRLAGSSQEPVRARRAGLTEEGEAVVRSVLVRGALVDVAHASDAAFDDIARIAREMGSPLVDSHTGVRALVDIERNLDDERLRAIAESGGVIGIDLHSGHVSPRPGEAATLRDVADHLEHAARIAGFDHVGIGSDLEGGIEPPADADGEATWPRIASILRERGWTEAQIGAVFSGNARRVLSSARDRRARPARPPGTSP